MRSFVSYPYQSSTANATPNCAGAGDNYTYDALSRTISQTHSDGTSITTSYTGAATSVSDEGNGTRATQKISQVDGLGRLVSVCEVTSTSLIGITPTPAACSQDIAATGFLTTYQYDPLGNLTSVTQGGLNSRTFSYDSLSRLITATNPESGTTCYGTWSGSVCSGGYDADSNLLKRTRPKPNQASSSVTVTATYAYDELHRVRSTSYSDTTPAVTMNYDETTALGVALSNTTGRQSSAYTGPVGSITTGSVFSYDNMGRVVNNSQCTPQNCATGTWPLLYYYDLLGDMTASTNGKGGVLTYMYNQAGRLKSLTSNLSDANHPGTLIGSIHYNAYGAALNDQLGNAVSDSFTYTPRGWVQSGSTTKNSATIYSFSITAPGGGIGYSGNGDVRYVNDNINGNWTYAYDDLNRLLSSACAATCPNGLSAQSFTYDYDRFGNRWHQNAPQGGPAPQYSFDVNNRISGSGMTYDAAGNITNDSFHTYTYDAENRITQVDAGGATGTYVYDAAGQRARKTTASATVDYLYDLSGHLITEIDSSGAWTRGEVYAGGRHVATYSGGVNGTTYFSHADWLGTERARTRAIGTVSETCVSLAFGDGQACAGGNDPSPLHFTGKMRDLESGLDEFPARYYSSVQGRWLSPDWSATPVAIPYALLDHPQTLNLYDYVGDDPTNHPDADGHLAGELQSGTGTAVPDVPPDETSVHNGWSLSWQINASASFLGQELQGVADATITPVVNAVEHPVEAVKGVADAVAHPVETAKNIVNGAVDTVKAAANGNPRAIGQIVGTVAAVAYAAENVRPQLYENAGGGGVNILNTPTTGSRIGLDIHGIPEAGGGVRPHIDITIKNPGIPSGPGSNLLNIKHWPW